ncbi:MAG: hypothetical protein ACFHWX_15265 [Bacteroidota bacterium]
MFNSFWSQLCLGQETKILEDAIVDHVEKVQDISELISDRKYYWPVPEIKKPGYLETIIDPVFGTKITRISGDPGDSINGIPNAVWPAQESRHGYSKRQAWNADQSMIFLDRSYPHMWLDGETYEVLFTRTFKKGHPDRPKMDLRWSHFEPDIMYYLVSDAGKSHLGKWDVVNNILTPLIDLSDYLKCSFGQGEGNFTSDGKKAAVYAIRKDIAQVIFVVDVTEKVKGVDIEVTTLDNCTISPNGNYIVIDGDFFGGSDRIQVRNANDGKVIWTESEYGLPSHFDVQIDQNGDEVVVGVGKSKPYDGNVIKRRLSDGKISVLVEGSYAMHTSGRNLKRPGWVYVTYNLRDKPSMVPYQNEIVAVRLDGRRVERLGNIHSNDFTYAAQAHGSPSPDGLRVIFASDWDSGSYPVQAYIIDMRDYILK